MIGDIDSEQYIWRIGILLLILWQRILEEACVASSGDSEIHKSVYEALVS